MQGLGAQTLVLRLSKAFLPDRLYWVSVCEKHAPVLAIVEHTHFMDSRHYGGEHIVYLGNYLPKDHPYMTMSPEQLLKMMDPFLQRISPGYKKHLIGMDVYSVPFAQPIVTPDYHRLIPSMQTPLKHVLLANMQQVYPWDRGTNYAVALGIKAADMI
jgi:protoporphyrinogen oxidase